MIKEDALKLLDQLHAQNKGSDYALALFGVNGKWSVVVTGPSGVDGQTFSELILEFEKQGYFTSVNAVENLLAIKIE